MKLTLFKEIDTRIYHIGWIQYWIPVNSKETALKCIKLHVTKFSKQKSENVKFCCINIHLTFNTLFFHKYCMCLYMTFTHYLNKMFYNKVTFGSNFTDLFKTVCTHGIYQNTNLIVYQTQCNSLFCDFFSGCHM